MVKPLAEERDLDDVSKFIVSGKAGEFIFQEGDRTTDMYIIQEGHIEILKHYAGEVRQISVLEPGDFFGELALLEQAPCQASARAATDYRLLRIDQSTFDQVVEQNPEIAVRMIRKLSRWLREREEADLRAAEIALGALRPAVGQVSAPAAAEGAPEAGVLAAVLVHEATGTEFRVPDGTETTIGRVDRATGIAPDIDLAKLDAKRTVGRRHAKILRRAGDFYLCEEIGTRNGTCVNDTRLKTGVETKLRDGDRLRFGLVDTVFQLR